MLLMKVKRISQISLREVIGRANISDNPWNWTIGNSNTTEIPHRQNISAGLNLNKTYSKGNKGLTMKLLSIRFTSPRLFNPSTRRHVSFRPIVNTVNVDNNNNHATPALNEDKEEKSNIGVIIASVISVLGGGIVLFFLVIKISDVVLTRRLKWAELEKACENCQELNREFDTIPIHKHTGDVLPKDATGKNRFSNVIPEPRTRVTLEDGQYINANYIQPVDGQTKGFIATQAPLENTQEDFWKMVWEQQSQIIIMLVNIIENNQPKCTQYWPDTERGNIWMYCGKYEILLQKRTEHDDLVHSTLLLKYTEKDLSRQVHHIWLKSWSEINDSKDSSTKILNLTKFCRPYIELSQGRPIVHCSTGTGRTGTVIAILISMNDYDQEKWIDILNRVQTIRNDRNGSVQTKEQYKLIYEVLYLYAKSKKIER
ncbi:DgyrCDS11759 [Dimorphilus gyrociliatus]|uniref:DgyrCDS11759 n=1 Tax=Dimorphilus gyrociliatus TaxID=2664684 RepID=A0A7I8W8A1_9ANNE|nr:DgyrCDS11759 [Dimorphilus gyrociliatus]